MAMWGSCSIMFMVVLYMNFMFMVVLYTNFMFMVLVHHRKEFHVT